MASSQRNRARKPKSAHDLLSNMGSGLLVGGGIAAFALLVGVGRAALAVLSGGDMAPLTSDDLRGLGAYVGGFLAGGAVVGALWTFLPGRAGPFISLSIGGVIVMCSIAVGEEGWANMTRFHWILATILGIIFGCAGAYGAGRGGWR